MFDVSFDEPGYTDPDTHEVLPTIHWRARFKLIHIDAQAGVIAVELHRINVDDLFQQAAVPVVFNGSATDAILAAAPDPAKSAARNLYDAVWSAVQADSEALQRVCTSRNPPPGGFAAPSFTYLDHP